MKDSTGKGCGNNLASCGFCQGGVFIIWFENRLLGMDGSQLSSEVQVTALYMGVSNNRDTPKWMVYNGKPYKNRWLGVENPLFSETSTWISHFGRSSRFLFQLGLPDSPGIVARPPCWAPSAAANSAGASDAAEALPAKGHRNPWDGKQ